jgi:hypothetical protein
MAFQSRGLAANLWAATEEHCKHSCHKTACPNSDIDTTCHPTDIQTDNCPDPPPSGCHPSHRRDCDPPHQAYALEALRQGLRAALSAAG